MGAGLALAGIQTLLPEREGQVEGHYSIREKENVLKEKGEIEAPRTEREGGDPTPEAVGDDLE